MISMEDWATTRNLKSKNPAIGSRKIADMLSISIKTVKRVLKDDIHQYKRGRRKIKSNAKSS